MIPVDLGVNIILLSVILSVTIVKISGKCGILSGEIVSQVVIVRSERYGMPNTDAARVKPQCSGGVYPCSQNWNLVLAPWPK